MNVRTTFIVLSFVVASVVTGCAVTEAPDETVVAAPERMVDRTPHGVCLVIDSHLSHSSLAVTTYRLLEKKGFRVVVSSEAATGCRVEVRLKGRWNESFTGLVDGMLSYRDLQTGETRVVEQRSTRTAKMDNAFLATNPIPPEDVLEDLVDRLFPDRYSPKFVRVSE